MRPCTAVSPGGVTSPADPGVRAATVTLEPGASISEPPWNHTEPAVIVMLPGVKVVCPGADVAVVPSESGSTVVTDPSPNVSAPARNVAMPPDPVSQCTGFNPGYAVSDGVSAMFSSTVEIRILPGVLTSVVTPTTPFCATL